MNSKPHRCCSVPIEEFSAKVRQGPAIDDEKTTAFPTWAGVVPLEAKVAGDPIDDATTASGAGGTGVTCDALFALETKA